MRNAVAVLSFAFSLVLAGFPVADARGFQPSGEGHKAAAASPIWGDWSGEIKLPGAALRIAIELSNTEPPSGTIAIPAQGVRGMALGKIAVDGERVRFVIPDIPGEPSFDGRVEGDTVVGTFSQSGASFPFELKRGEPAAARRPQDPRPPFPYAIEEVTATNGEVVLSGTLTRPEGDGPFPAAVLITGSGPQNRDEELFDHRPFAVLADHLSRAGMLVVRYDDRGIGQSTGSFAEATSTMLSEDAEAWIGFLKARDDVSRVGLIGHSEGAMLAAMVAARNTDVDFIVMLAGTGVDGATVLVEQNRAMMLAAGADPQAADVVAGLARDLFDAIKAGESDEQLSPRVMALARSQGAAADDTIMQQMIQQQLRSMRSPWFKEFLSYDPKQALRRVRVPVLAINGGKDVQVVPSQNLPAIAAALQEAGNTRVRIEELSGLNHLFQRCTTGAVAEYGQIEETMNPAALDLVRDWVLEPGRAPGRGGSGAGSER